MIAVAQEAAAHRMAVGQRRTLRAGVAIVAAAARRNRRHQHRVFAGGCQRLRMAVLAGHRAMRRMAEDRARHPLRRLRHRGWRVAHSSFFCLSGVAEERASSSATLSRLFAVPSDSIPWWNRQSLVGMEERFLPSPTQARLRGPPATRESHRRHKRDPSAFLPRLFVLGPLADVFPSYLHE